MNTLSSSSICVFLRMSDLVLSFSSSSCFFCFKVWEKKEYHRHRKEPRHLTINAVKSMVRNVKNLDQKVMVFFLIRCKAKSSPDKFGNAPFPTPASQWHDFFLQFYFWMDFDVALDNDDWPFKIGSHDFSRAWLRYRFQGCLRLLIGLQCKFQACCLTLWNWFSRIFARFQPVICFQFHFKILCLNSLISLVGLGYSFARQQTAKFGFCFFQPLTQPSYGLRPFKRNNSRNISAFVCAF